VKVAVPSISVKDIKDATIVGWLYKQGFLNKNWKKRWFILKVLIYLFIIYLFHLFTNFFFFKLFRIFVSIILIQIREIIKLLE